MHSVLASLYARILKGSRLRKLAMGFGAAVLASTTATVANAAPARTAATVNMRTGPAVSYPIVTAIPRGSVVEVYTCLRSRPWCDVDWDGWRGWVSARFLRYTGGSYNYVPLYEIFPIIGIPVFTGVPVIYPRVRRPRPRRPGIAPTPRPPLPPTVAPRPRSPRVAPAPTDRRIRPAPTPPTVRAPRAVAPPSSPRIVPDRAPIVRPPVSRAPSAPMMAPRPAAPPSAPSGGGGRLRLPVGGGGGAMPPSPR